MKLVRWLYWHYREFWLHPEYRGPEFNWTVPAQLAWHRWKWFP